MPVWQKRVLQLIAERSREERATSYRSLVREWGLSDVAACRHLGRLWRERLIETPAARPDRFHFRLEPGESLRDLRFQITARGRERLRWYAREAKRREELR